MRIWVMSDLHLGSEPGWDVPPPDRWPPFDVLVAAGDLIPRQERGVRWLADRVTDRPVIFVAGNHESYGEDIDRDVVKARKAAIGTSVRVIQDQILVLGDVTFVGATFWTNFGLFGNAERSMALASDVMNDYAKIRKDDYRQRLRPMDTFIRNRKSREIFAEAARNAKTGKIVAITHHCPSPLGLKMGPDLTIGSEIDPIAAAYVNTGCEDLIERFDLWIYGHTHETRLFHVGRTPVVTNAKGYGVLRDGTRDNPDFDLTFTVEI
jgi:3',5'-cyclic AMP phosphodiesterase CpdA